MALLQVRDIMSTDLVTLEEGETLLLAENVMQHGRIRHLPVVKGDELIGLVTHRDILRARISSLADIGPEERADMKLAVPVREIMSTGIKTVSPDTSVLDAARIIKNNKYGCLPVTEQGKLVGIITEADFIDLVITALDGQ